MGDGVIAYYVCPICGSDDVQILNWTRPNENSIPAEMPHYMPEGDHIATDSDAHAHCGTCGVIRSLRCLAPDNIPFASGYARAPERWALDILQRADDPLVYGSDLREAELCEEEPGEESKLYYLADRGYLEAEHDEDGNLGFKLTVLGINTVKHFRGRKRCVKCGDPILDPQLPDGVDERCYEHRD
jgi:hypothetical protein